MLKHNKKARIPSLDSRKFFFLIFGQLNELTKLLKKKDFDRSTATKALNKINVAISKLKSSMIVKETFLGIIKADVFLTNKLVAAGFEESWDLDQDLLRFLSKNPWFWKELEKIGLLNNYRLDGWEIKTASAKNGHLLADIFEDKVDAKLWQKATGIDVLQALWNLELLEELTDEEAKKREEKQKQIHGNAEHS